MLENFVYFCVSLQLGAQWVAKGLKFLTAENKDCDQTLQIDFNLPSTHIPTCMLDIGSYLERKKAQKLDRYLSIKTINSIIKRLTLYLKIR